MPGDEYRTDASAGVAEVQDGIEPFMQRDPRFGEERVRKGMNAGPKAAARGKTLGLADPVPTTTFAAPRAGGLVSVFDMQNVPQAGIRIRKQVQKLSYGQASEVPGQDWIVRHG
ncbi:hypothetical protein [Novosphingobium sp. B 225]|uniref:hypothetical protein n=1 Tax=Novosphingobium sp. B 225 TaxID=1961849 RepID=UPI001124DFBB|nr:hypothetical protein [Novosphingobium sp. B 225]